MAIVFKPYQNHVFSFKGGVPDYELAAKKLAAFDSLTCLGNDLMYVRDLFNNTFRCISGTPPFYSGFTIPQIKDIGSPFIAILIQDEDAYFLMDFENVYFPFIQALEPHRRKDVLITQSFNFTHKDGGFLPVNIRLNPILSDDDENIWMLLSRVSFASIRSKHEASIELLDTGERFRFDRQNARMVPAENLQLTHTEKVVLSYASIGHTEKELSEFLSISPNTVKTHKSNIYKKLDVNNITEAYVVAYKLNLL